MDGIVNADVIGLTMIRRVVYVKALVGWHMEIKNEEITLTTCTPVKTADEVDPDTLQRPVWGKTWTLPEANEILIGPKQDPACFVVFPGADSVGKLCYVNQQGSKYYDMENAKAIKEKLDVE